jgi:hypothetical protein
MTVVLGPAKCQQCRVRVRWERWADGTLRLVNDRTGTPHRCQR